MPHVHERPNRTRRLLALVSAAALTVALSAGLPLAASADTPCGDVDVTAAPYAAQGDGATNDRAAIQAAIDDCAAVGGGTVVLSVGHTFLSGGLVLKDDVTLRIDGTLKQSQNVDDYASPKPGLGHYAGGDMAAFSNQPFIYAADVSGVGVAGSGLIQMTGVPNAMTIETAAIGFYKVQDYEIRDVQILGCLVYNVMLYTTDHGLVKGVTIESPEVNVANTDGISIMNSSNLRITQNSITTDDDALYVAASYKDPRGGWWSSDIPAPSRHIEIDNNDLRTKTNGHAFAFIPWGASAPDQSQVEISDIYVHDNSLVGGTPYGSALGAYDDMHKNPAGWGGGSLYPSYQSAITRVTFENNTYSGAIYPMRITDLKADFPMLGTGTSLNGDFSSGDASWTGKGEAGFTTRETLPSALAAGDVPSGLDGRFGYVVGSDPDSALYQALGVGSAAPLTGITPNDGVYSVSTQIATRGGTAEIFVQDTCTDTTLATKQVTHHTLSREVLTFTPTENCENVRIGVRMLAGNEGWAVLDDFDVTPPALHALDPENVYSGYWLWWTAWPQVWRGSSMLASSPGQSVTNTFSGDRALVLATSSENSGIASVSVDGKPAVDVDLYSPEHTPGDVVFDTGELGPGEHTIRIEPSGRKNPSATSTWLVFNSVVVVPETPTEPEDPTLTIDAEFDPAAPNGKQGWYTTGVTVTGTAVTTGEVDAVAEFSTDGSAFAPLGESKTISTEGESSVWVRASDGEHTSEVVKRDLLIDLSAPTARADEADRVVTLKGEDAVSGLGRVEYRLSEDPEGTWRTYDEPFTVAGTSPTIVTYRAVDVAGNVGEIGSLEIDGIEAPGTPSIVLDRGSVKQGDSLKVTGSGFESEAELTVWLYSEPVQVGTVRSDAQGGLAVTIQVPTSVDPGNHRVVVRAGDVVLAEAAVTIVAAEVDPELPTVDPELPTGGLASTGSEDMTALLSLGLALLLGGGFIVTRRMRRSSRPE